jgi:hypothetical protein
VVITRPHFIYCHAEFVSVDKLSYTIASGREDARILLEPFVVSLSNHNGDEYKTPL